MLTLDIQRIEIPGIGQFGPSPLMTGVPSLDASIDPVNYLKEALLVNEPEALVLALGPTLVNGSTIAKEQLQGLEKRVIWNAKDDLRTATNQKGERASDVYRRFAKALRWIYQNGILRKEAQRILADISLEQTMPFGELESPYWIDSYTGEPFENEDEIEPGKPSRVPASEWTKAAFETKEKLINDLGYTDAQVQKFFSANEDFNADEFSEEIIWDETDPIKPMWQRIQEDTRTSDDYQYIQAEVRPIAEALQSTINQMVDFCKANPVKGVPFPTLVKQAVRESQEAGDFLDLLQVKLNEGADPQDIATLFLSKQHAFCFNYDDAGKLNLSTQNRIFAQSSMVGDKMVRLGRVIKESDTLLTWLEEYGDDLLEGMNDSVSGKKYLEEEAISDAYVTETIALYSQTGSLTTKNINQHPFFIEGYLRAAMNSKELLSSEDDGKRHNVCVEAGWENWREKTNVEGNQAYHLAKDTGSDNKTAMKAFWRIVNHHPAEKRLDEIASIKPLGLTLVSGRFIDWRIAAIKFREQEIKITAERKAELKKILQQKGWGLQLVSIL